MKKSEVCNIFWVNLMLTFFSNQAQADNCKILDGQWEVKEHVTNNCGSNFKTTFIRTITTQEENYKEVDKLIKSSSMWVYKGEESDSGKCSINGNNILVDTNEHTEKFRQMLALSPDKMSIEGTYTSENNCGQVATISAKRLSLIPSQSYTSNSNNNTQQNKSHHERVNIPNQNGCVSIGKSKKPNLTNDSQWFLFKNSCPYPVNVRWCGGKECVNSTSTTTISSGGTDESWTKRDSDGRTHVTTFVCQETSGTDEVYIDWLNKQCWTNVQLR